MASYRQRPRFGLKANPCPRIGSLYDQDTGQVYAETRVSAHPRQHVDWIGAPRTSSLLKQAQPCPSGTRSLLETARIQTARHMRDLTTEHLANVPWHLAKDLWQWIVTIRAESFHAWRTFACAYPTEFDAPSYRYLLQVRQPVLPLQSYFESISNSKSRWITCLRLSPQETRTADLVALSTIANLAVLDMSDGQSTLDDRESNFEERVMRTWAELAREEGSFACLEALLFGWQPNLGLWLFKYLPCFPSLRHVIITDCPQLNQRNRKEWESVAFNAGWTGRHAKKSAKSLRPILNEPDFQYGAVSKLCYEPHSTSVAEESEYPKATVPILECWLGSPKVWTHIVDDFPSTRTILFDRHAKEGVKRTAPNMEISKRTREKDQSSADMSSPPPKKHSKQGTKLKCSVNLPEMLAEITS